MVDAPCVGRPGGRGHPRNGAPTHRRGRSLAEAFANPHQFDAGRFKNSVQGNDTYAPFGVDHHQCPMGGLAIRLGMIFLKALACGYRVTALTPGPPTRGAHHWEPSPRFSVQLTPR